MIHIKTDLGAQEGIEPIALLNSLKNARERIGSASFYLAGVAAISQRQAPKASAEIEAIHAGLCALSARIEEAAKALGRELEAAPSEAELINEVKRKLGDLEYQISRCAVPQGAFDEAEHVETVTRALDGAGEIERDVYDVIEGKDPRTEGMSPNFREALRPLQDHLTKLSAQLDDLDAWVYASIRDGEARAKNPTPRLSVVASQE